MSKMASYRMTMFMIFFNYGMMIANYLSGIIFPSNSPEIATFGGDILRGTGTFASFSSVNTISTLALTAGVLSLFAFSLLVPTIPFIVLFFSLNGIISAIYVNQFISIPPYIAGVSLWSLPLTMGIAIVYYMGISQYAARSSVEGA